MNTPVQLRFLLPALLCVYSTSALAKSSSRLMVSDLRSQGVDDALSATLTDLLIYELSRDERLNVVGDVDIRSNLELYEKKTALGCDQSCWVELAKQLECSKLIHGSIGKIGRRATLNITLIDSKTGDVTTRINHTLFGYGANWMPTIQVTAQEITDTIFEAQTSDTEVPLDVDVQELRQLRIAEQPMTRNLKLNGGVGFFFAGAEDLALSRPFFSTRLSADQRILPRLSLGLEVGGFTNAFVENGLVFYGDVETATGAISKTQAESVLSGFYAALRILTKPPKGWWAPYLGMSVGAGYLNLDLGDSIPINSNMPQAFTLMRSGNSGVTGTSRVFAGYQVMTNEFIAVDLEVSLFYHINGLDFDVRMANDDEAIYRGKLGDLRGASLSLGVTWQD